MFSNAVQFSQPKLVTNTLCCSNSRIMCERCAAAALAAERRGTPVQNAGRRVFDPEEDCDVMSPRPLIEREVQRPTHNNDCEDWQMIVQPLIARDRHGNAIVPTERSATKKQTDLVDNHGFDDEDRSERGVSFENEDIEAMSLPPLVTNEMRRHL